MKRIASSFFCLIACGIGAIGLCACAQRVDSNSTRLRANAESSRCFDGLTIHVTSNPSNITYGESSAVSWSVSLPAGCTSVQEYVRLNGEDVTESGSRTVTPPRSTTYTVSVLLVGEPELGQRFQGTMSAATRVTVSYPTTVVIDPSTSDPVDVLLGALVDSKNDTQTVELCNVDLDLTGYSNICVDDNRSLIASPTCARGPRSLGPRIFVTDKRGDEPLFVISGDHVTFSGFRLEGPTSDVAQGDVKEKGIVISPWDDAPDPIRHIEISNMEIFHWSGVGVQVTDAQKLKERGRLFNTNPGAVHIYGNFFHDNRHGAGFGYGVAVTNGAYATIEQNVFDENRHAIAGGSVAPGTADYSGYTARDNLILSGGGLHCRDSAGADATIGGVIGGVIGGLFGGPFGAGIGAGIGAGGGAIVGSWCWQTHLIDMHGDQNDWYSSNNWECGTAGETIIIERNTILYDHGYAIKIRGNPADTAVVDGNVFKHKSRADAISQNGDCGFGDNITNPIDVRPNNIFGADPMAKLGSCDFFGDGQQDQFMATGVTWWAKSPTTQQWRYLNTMPEMLSQLELGDFDREGVCDVAQRTNNPAKPPERYSKSGTGPWIPLIVIKP